MNAIGKVDVVRFRTTGRNRNREKRDNPMFTDVRVPECDFIFVVRVREIDFAIGDAEEAVT